MRRRGVRLDAIPVAASALAWVTLVAYLVLIRQEGDAPAPWAVTALLGGAALATYGAAVAAPYRRAALAIAGSPLMALGVLSSLTIGLPILVAGILCLVAATRRRSEASG